MSFFKLLLYSILSEKDRDEMLQWEMEEQTELLKEQNELLKKQLKEKK
jgi:hypothetical protein